MRLRYKKNGSEWMPEYLPKSGVWKTFTEDGLKTNAPELYELACKLGELQKVKAFYSNTKELFFRDEMLIMAFLGAAQFYKETEIKDFEIFLDENK